MNKSSTTATILAQRISEALKSFNATEVAERCGVSKQAVSNRKSTGRIDKRHLYELSKMTGLPIQYWLGADIPENRDEAETELLLLFRALRDDEREAIIKNARLVYASAYDTQPPHQTAVLIQQSKAEYKK